MKMNNKINTNTTGEPEVLEDNSERSMEEVERKLIKALGLDCEDDDDSDYEPDDNSRAEGDSVSVEYDSMT